MEDRVCLDTDFLVDFLRKESNAVTWLRENEGKKELATTIINIFELYVGAYKSRDREQKIKALKELTNRLIILKLSIPNAEEAGRIMAELESMGNVIEIRDLLIGAISLKEDYTLKTNNKKHFSRINGLQVI